MTGTMMKHLLMTTTTTAVLVLLWCMISSHVVVAVGELKPGLDNNEKNYNGDDATINHHVRINDVDVDVNTTKNSYVFLQKFPLENTNNFLFHTEVLVCLHDQFSEEDQKYLDDKISTLTDFVEIDEDWWSSKSTYSCVEMGYGGAACTERCCAVPHGTNSTDDFPLNERRAVIGNADTTQKSLYLYGKSNDIDGEVAYHHTCDHKCWSNWAGTDYNPLTNNCNTFTSTVLRCVFGLSEKKPNLGPSDMVTVTCDKCPSEKKNRDDTWKTTN